MPKYIDDEIQKVTRSGFTPTVIEVGLDAYTDIQNETSPLAAEVFGVDGKAAAYDEEEVTEYKGLKVVKRDDVANDYLKIR